MKSGQKSDSQPNACFSVPLCFRPPWPVVAPLDPVPSLRTCRQLSHTQEDQRRLKAPLPGTSHDRSGAPLSLRLDPKRISHTHTRRPGPVGSGPASARSVETLRGDCGRKVEPQRERSGPASVDLLKED